MIKNLYTLLCIGLTGVAIAQNDFSISSGPAMSQSRVGHRSVELPNGKILIMGGDNGDVSDFQVSNSTAIYDPVSNSMTNSAPMLQKRADFMAVTLNDGRVMALGGGYTSPDSALYTTEFYDYQTNVWSKGPRMSTWHIGGRAVKLPNGRVMVAGGVNTKICEIFYPELNMWVPTGEMAAMHGEELSLTLMASGKVVAIGGSTAGKLIETFDPISNMWSAVGSLTYARKAHSALAISAGEILITGGNHSETEISKWATSEVFDGYTFTKNLSTMINNSVYDPIMKLDNGKYLVHCIGDPFTPASIGSFQLYDPSTAKWSNSSVNMIGNDRYTTHKLTNGKIIIIGGNFTTGNGASSTTYLLSTAGLANCVAPNTNMLAQALIQCYGKSQQVTLKNSEVGVSYSLLNGSRENAISNTGNGGDLVFDIPYGKYSIGKQGLDLEIQKSGCAVLTTKNIATITVATPSTAAPKIVIRGEDSTICGNSDLVKLAVVYPVAGTQYYWNQILGDTTKTVTSSSSISVTTKDANGCSSLESNIKTIKKTTGKDISLTSKDAFCIDGTAVTLKAYPQGGVWSGLSNTIDAQGNVNMSYYTGGNSSYSNSFYYKVCDVEASFSIVFNRPVVNGFKETMVNWGSTSDTLCGGVQRSIYVSYYNEDLIYKFYANDTLLNVKNTSSPSFYHMPTYGKSVNYRIVSSPDYQSRACPYVDSVVVQKKFFLYPMPNPNTKVILPDTSCIGKVTKVKVVHPEVGINYYTSFYPHASNNWSTFVKIDKPQDTLYIDGVGMYAENSTRFQVAATSDGMCKTVVKTALTYKDIIGKPMTNNVLLNDLYYLGDQVSVGLTSNYDVFRWTINGTDYNAKIPPTFVYNAVSEPKYRLISVSNKYGCVDTVSRIVKIRKKSPKLPGTETCIADTLKTQLRFNSNAIKSIVDNAGNVLSIGWHNSDYGAYYSYSTNAYLAKFDKNGNLLWKTEQDAKQYSSITYYYSTFINSLAVDESNNIYVVGNYCALEFKFLGFTTAHTDASNPYVHSYIAKISPSGQLLWIDYSYGYTTTMGVGSGDVVYKNGKLYVVANTAYQYWKNRSGTELSPDISGTHNVMVLNATNGDIEKRFAYSVNRNDFHAIGYYSFSSSSVYVQKVATLGMRLQVLADGRILVFGKHKEDIDFTSFVCQASKKGVSEFVAVLDENTGWVSCQNNPAIGNGVFYRNEPLAVVGEDKYIYSAANSEPYVLSYSQTPYLYKYSIYYSSTDSVGYKDKKMAVLFKKELGGPIHWKRELSNTEIYKVVVTPSKFLLVVGRYVNQMEMGIINAEYGYPNASNGDLFVMLIDPANGETIGMESFSSTDTDTYLALALSTCNEAYLMARFGGTVAPFKTKSFGPATYAQYLVKFPLFGTCASPCVVTSLEGLEASGAAEQEEGHFVPNPTTGTISYPYRLIAADAWLQVYSLDGRMLKAARFAQDAPIDLSIYGKGVYLVKYSVDGAGIKTQKVIVTD